MSLHCHHLVDTPLISKCLEFSHCRNPVDKDEFLQHDYYNIGIKHGFPCINVCQVPRVMLKTETKGRGFQHFPRDLVNVNTLEINV